MKQKYHQLLFVFRFGFVGGLIRRIRTVWFSLLGLEIGAGTLLPEVYITWPHQVKLGSNCKLEHAISFKFDGIWKPGPSIIIGDNNFIGNNCEFNIKESIVIGNNNLIASGCRFVDHDHGIAIGELMKDQLCKEVHITIGNDVWIGANAIILKGITINDGAIIGAGAVVNKSIPLNEIWAGVPAKKIGHR